MARQRCGGGILTRSGAVRRSRAGWCQAGRMQHYDIPNGLTHSGAAAGKILGHSGAVRGRAAPV